MKFGKFFKQILIYVNALLILKYFLLEILDIIRTGLLLVWIILFLSHPTKVYLYETITDLELNEAGSNSYDYYYDTTTHNKPTAKPTSKGPVTTHKGPVTTPKPHNGHPNGLSIEFY